MAHCDSRQIGIRAGRMLDHFGGFTLSAMSIEIGKITWYKATRAHLLSTAKSKRATGSLAEHMRSDCRGAEVQIRDQPDTVSDNNSCQWGG